MPKLQTLQPGEVYAENVNFWVIEENAGGPAAPGRYALQAVFSYADFANWEFPGPFYVSRSAAIPLEVGDVPWVPGGRSRWRLLPAE
jgi:hypothetical protein